MMRLHFYSLFLVLLFGLAVIASAQMSDPPEFSTEQQEAIRKQQAVQRTTIRSPAMQQMQKNAMKRMMNSLWNGEGMDLMAIGLLLQDNDFQGGIGASQEQHQKIQEAMRSGTMEMMNDPGIKSIQWEIQKLAMGIPDDGLFGENVSEETRQKFFELQVNLQVKTQEFMIERMTTTVNESLTRDQMKKVKEFQISMMEEMPIISPSMFDAFDLSDAQKQQLDEIKKELQPEFEKNIDKMIDVQMKFTEKMQDELERLLEITDPEERQMLMERVTESVRKEFQQEMNNMTESGKGFANQLKFKMFDVLTDEQMERMADLIDNPPDYVKKAIIQIRKQMGNDDSSTTASGEWKPNANSWKPGDPIPAEYLEQRQERRFPRRN